MKDTKILTDNGINLKESLDLFGDMNSYEETLKDYLNGVDTKIEKLRMFKDQNDMPNYAIIAHSLKSDARYLGFTHLQELAYNHEMESKANNLLYANEHFEELLTETNRINTIVKTYMGSTYSIKEERSPSNISSLKSILVVDDSEIIRNFIKKAADNTLNIINANDGEEAINFLNNNSNIIGMLLDLNMPNVDGFAVLEHLKEKGLFKEVAVSIITGEDSKEVIEKAFTYPIVDVLTKPFTDEDVKRIVNKTLDYQTKY